VTRRSVCVGICNFRSKNANSGRNNG
jgi:hypothetical protein